ncbi:hypothetical protein [Streptomyces sp. NPDC008150]|uniref:hypothetical protein n=1 Tax=Streptomyces sp. NPDC008150 TaxID=3364816 RepID=UPI0036E6A198
MPANNRPARTPSPTPSTEARPGPGPRAARRRRTSGRSPADAGAAGRTDAAGNGGFLGGSVLNGTLLLTGLVSGRIPATPQLLWPLVILSIAILGHDLCRRRLTSDSPERKRRPRKAR